MYERLILERLSQPPMAHLRGAALVAAAAACVPPGAALRRGLAETGADRRTEDENIALGSQLLAREVLRGSAGDRLDEASP
jgi:hypothetical protein